ncbi:hypothetical protein [Winogradskyella sp. PE311]|uniref:hypothetical protein n=1 Tax=Winogradskyella sp. PE311 TaxID=3366943 RepID=UPI003980157C
MKLKYLISFFGALLFLISCEDDDENLNAIGKVTFAITELVEVENATNPLNINVGIDSFNHAGGTIDISISGGDYGVDYETSEGSNSFTLDVEAQTLFSTFSLTPIDDQNIESNLPLTITITSVSGSLELGENTTLTFIIIDNDDPLIALVNFENNTEQIDENQATSESIQILFDQATTDGGTLSVSSFGDAIYGVDYTVDGQTSGDFVINVPSGSTSTSFAVQPIDNANFEANKTITFTLDEVSGGLSLGAETETTITLVNDDASPNPIIDFSPSNTLNYSEAEGTITLNFDISETTTSDATIELTTSGNADISDFNFSGSNANPYAFVIPSGSSTGSVAITLVDDTDTESDETLTLEITSVTGGLDAGANLQSQTIIITDNDGAVPFSYIETFESNDGTNSYLNSVLNYQNALANQTIDPNQLIDLITNTGSFSDVEDETGSSDNGLNLFYNTGNDSALNGTIDNVVITPIIEGVGPMDISIDAAYAFKNQNAAMVTFYWSQTYDGSGSFNENDWTVMGTESVPSMDAEGFGNNNYKRQEFSISPTADFYIAIRVTGIVDDTNYRLRWRFDNITAISQ